MDGSMKNILWAICFLGLAGSARAEEPEFISVHQGTHSFVPADSMRPSISGDGNLVAFESLARLTPDDRNKAKDVYVFDRRAKAVRLVKGMDAKKFNGGPALSGDGKVIAFH